MKSLMNELDRCQDCKVLKVTTHQLNGSSLVQVMAWCCEVTSHYLNQHWRRSLTSYGITRAQWVNRLPHFPKQFPHSPSFCWMIQSHRVGHGQHLNSLAPGGFENIFQNVFFKLISWIDTLSNSCETALRSMPQNPSDDKSTLVQVMAWCRQAASHYLSQCCPRSLSPYGVTRPQWVNL